MNVQHMIPLLKEGKGEGTTRGAAAIANITCKMASLRDNLLGGWYSYRASKASLNQCMLNWFVSSMFVYFLFQFTTEKE